MRRASPGLPSPRKARASSSSQTSPLRKSTPRASAKASSSKAPRE